MPGLLPDRGTNRTVSGGGFANRVADALNDRDHIQPRLGELFLSRGVGDQPIGHAEAMKVGRGQSMGDGKFEDG